MRAVWKREVSPFAILAFATLSACSDDSGGQDVVTNDADTQDAGPDAAHAADVEAGPMDGMDADASLSDDVRLEFDFAEFNAEMEAIVEEYDLEGATVALVHRDAGVVLERAFGGFEMDRQANLASSSKVLAAGVLLRLADDGLLDLDVPISEIIGDWGERDHDPTLAQLLSNSSGMSGLIDNPAFAPYLCMFSDSTTLGACGRDIYTSPDDRLNADPDTEYRYGGAPWQLAGAIAESVSGKSWNTLIDEIYVQPCELEGLAYGNPFGDFIVEAVSSQQLAYPEDGLVLEPSDNPNIEGGAYTSAGDYGRLLLMHLRGGQCPGGRVLSESAVERMREDRVAEWGGSASLGPYEYSLTGYGLGWWIDRDVPGFVNDPGIFGATPWLDEARGYAGMILVEDRVELAEVFLERLIPLAAEAVDTALEDAP